MVGWKQIQGKVERKSGPKIKGGKKFIAQNIQYFTKVERFSWQKAWIKMAMGA